MADFEKALKGRGLIVMAHIGYNDEEGNAKACILANENAVQNREMVIATTAAYFESKT
jgi:hypothetical protein